MKQAEIVFEQPEHGDRTHHGGEVINSARFAFLMLLGADVMLYVGLLGGYLVLRGGSLSWPPPGSPKLTLGLMTWTLPVMLLAAIAMGRSMSYQRRNQVSNLRTALIVSFVLQVVFLVINAFEWRHLFDQGLELMTVFGGIYLIVMGTFFLHIIGSLIYSTGVLSRVWKWRTYVRSTNSLTHLGYFVFLQALTWFVLFALIYL